MIEGVIHSENPKEHWEHLSASGKVILDLGCGFWTQEEREMGNGTAKYFISQNPLKYIGIDLNGADIKKLSNEFPQAIFIEKAITNPRDILPIIFEHQPSVLKCDIEGMESALFQLPEKYSIREIAIETHPGHHDSCIKWLNMVGLIPWRKNLVSFCSEIQVIYGKC